MDWSRDNLPGFVANSPWKWLLLPGVILQWLIYMFPQPGLTALAVSRRHARSPIMTIAYSAFFYMVCIVLLFAYAGN